MRKQLNVINFFAPVQPLLGQVEQLMRSQADNHHSELASALRHLLSSGGKRIRPAITLLAGGMLQGDPDRLVIVSAAIELLHTATLVHDDFIDGAVLRRGISTLNAQWSSAATVLTGDFIFARAAGLAAEVNSVAVNHLFAKTLATIVNGEITQLFSKNSFGSRSNYDQRIYAKTASLFEAATTSAALLSPVDESVVKNMSLFGKHIGMAFQIVDDVLDFTGEQATIGKPVASDLRQGLITLPSLYYLEAHPDDVDLHSILKNQPVDEGEIARLVAAIRESGAIEQSMQDARQFVQAGIDLLSGLPESVYKEALENLTCYIVDRRQ